MRFFFKAKDQAGNIKEGRIDSLSKDAAIEILQKNGFIPLVLEQEKKASKIVTEIKRTWEGVKAKDLLVFFRQLATLIEAKVPIVPSLLAIQDQADNRFMGTVIKEVSEDIEDGMPFSESLAKHPHVFSPLAVNIIKAGEVSGNLQRSISFVADNIERNYQLNSKIKSALYYPLFVIVVSIIIGFIVITVILPRLTGMIKDMDIEIPWYTKVVMFIGDFMAGYWWAIIIVVLGGIGGFIYYIKTEAGKREWDQVKIKLPIVGKLFRYIYLARFSDNLSVLLAGGIPVVRALAIVSDVVGNSVYESVILRSADEVKTGGNISTVLYKSADFPPIVSKMVKIGEETGKISDVLKSVASFYEQEIEKMARNLSTMIEPVLIVILGIGVAILVFAILLPIYNIAGQL